MQFLLNERDARAMGPQVMQREACLPGNSILQQLTADARIIDSFNLHHPEKKAWLLANWAGHAIHTRPIAAIYTRPIAAPSCMPGLLLSFLF